MDNGRQTSAEQTPAYVNDPCLLYALTIPESKTGAGPLIFILETRETVDEIAYMHILASRYPRREELVLL